MSNADDLLQDPDQEEFVRFLPKVPKVMGVQLLLEKGHSELCSIQQPLN